MKRNEYEVQYVIRLIIWFTFETKKLCCHCWPKKKSSSENSLEFSSCDIEWNAGVTGINPPALLLQ